MFPAAFFHYLPWSKDDPLPSKKQKFVRGQWASDGGLQKIEKYRCSLPSGIVYVAFSPEISFNETAELLGVIDAHTYELAFDTGSKDWDQWLREIEPKVFRELQIETINYVRSEDMRGERRLTVNVVDPKTGLSEWTFKKKDSGYVLVAMTPYAI